MNFGNILNAIEKVDPEVLERVSQRRGVFKSFSSKVALAALPFAVGSVFKKAYGQAPPSIVEVLNFALTLEYLESEFYKAGIAASGLIPTGPPSGAMATIGGHEAAHVAFLDAAITASGGTPVAKPKFDFTAGGAFKDVFTNYPTFLAVAQTFEDTGVRAYKGQAANLISNNDVLTAALNIHSVEARHAAHIRYMRSKDDAKLKPWITGKESGIGPAVQASYDGEEVTTQADIEIVDINGSPITASDASEAFDEPLSMEAILKIVKPFITG